MYAEELLAFAREVAVEEDGIPPYNLHEAHQHYANCTNELMQRFNDMAYHINEMRVAWPNDRVDALELQIPELERTTQQLTVNVDAHDNTLARITASIALQTQHAERTVGAIAQLHASNDEVKNTIASYAQQLVQIQHELVQTKEAIGSEVRQRENDVRAIGEILKRDREALASQQLSQSSACTPKPMVLHNPEMEIHLARLSSRVEQLEMTRPITQTPQLHHDQVVAQIHHEMEQHMQPPRDEIRTLRRNRVQYFQRMEDYVQR